LEILELCHLAEFVKRQTIKIFRRLFLFKFFFKSFFLPFPKFQNLLPKLFFCTKANPIKFQFSAFEKKSFNANLWNWAFYFMYIFVLFLRNFYSESFCKDKKMQNIEQTWFPIFFNGTINLKKFLLCPNLIKLFNQFIYWSQREMFKCSNWA